MLFGWILQADLGEWECHIVGNLRSPGDVSCRHGEMMLGVVTKTERKKVDKEEEEKVQEEEVGAGPRGKIQKRGENDRY